jgi:exonuclease VII large subunit
VVEAEREESSSKQVLEDSERDMLNALQQVLKKNNKEMLAVVTSAYVAGLQAFFATGVEKVQGLKAQLHDKVAEEEHDEDADVPEERAKEASKPEERGNATHTARDVFFVSGES